MYPNVGYSQTMTFIKKRLVIIRLFKWIRDREVSNEAYAKTLESIYDIMDNNPANNQISHLKYNLTPIKIIISDLIYRIGIGSSTFDYQIPYSSEQKNQHPSHPQLLETHKIHIQHENTVSLPCRHKNPI